MFLCIYLSFKFIQRIYKALSKFYALIVLSRDNADYETKVLFKYGRAKYLSDPTNLTLYYLYVISDLSIKYVRFLRTPPTFSENMLS